MLGSLGVTLASTASLASPTSSQKTMDSLLHSLSIATTMNGSSDAHSMSFELDDFAHIKRSITAEMTDIRSNFRALQTFCNRLAAVLTALHQHRSHSVATNRTLQCLPAFLASVQLFFSSHATKNTLRQFLNARVVAEQLEIFDQVLLTLSKSMDLSLHLEPHIVSMASRTDLEELANVLYYLTSERIEDQRMETLYDLALFDLDLLPLDVAGALRVEFCTLADRIKQSTGRGLSEHHSWSISSNDIQKIVFSATDSPTTKEQLSSTYRAVWNGHEVQVTTILPVKSREAAAQLECEADQWQSLNHPNILKLFGLCLNSDIPQLVTPVTYANLASLLERSPMMDVVTRSEYIVGIANGVKYLHSLPQPIVHGDLRAANIFIGLHDEVLVSNFGLASPKRLTPLPPDSIRWMAPEQYVRNYSPVPSLDVFSFAMTCYEVQTGLVPFYEQIHEHIVQGWMNNGERPYRPVNVPDAIWNVMQRCWTQDPLMRPTFKWICQNLDWIAAGYLNSGALGTLSTFARLVPASSPSFNRISLSSVSAPFSNRYSTSRSGFQQPAQSSSLLGHSGTAGLRGRFHSLTDISKLSMHDEAIESVRRYKSHSENVSFLSSNFEDNVFSTYPASSSSFLHDAIQNNLVCHSPPLIHSSNDTDTTIKAESPIFVLDINTDQEEIRAVDKYKEEGGLALKTPLNYATVVKVPAHTSSSVECTTTAPLSGKSVSTAETASSSVAPKGTTASVQSALSGTGSLTALSAINTREFQILNQAFPFWIQKHGVTASRLANRVCDAVDVWDPTCKNFSIKPSLEWHENGHLSVIRFPLSNISRPLHTNLLRLTDLTELALHRSGLNGQIPKEIGKLVNLTRLDFGVNYFDGPIPKEIGKLVKLEQLSLHKNSFTGPIPKEFGNLVEMKWLRLDHNRLSGKLPKEFGQMVKLMQLCIDGNSISREIPAQVYELPELREFRCDSDSSNHR
ncbi:hypothetical protein QVD99_002233 [Batrachochytrium dendrobatidis]|nr:hypothetical protein QVD99_002233 [Batrachochytrium dendrobatidis]